MKKDRHVYNCMSPKVITDIRNAMKYDDAQALSGVLKNLKFSTADMEQLTIYVLSCVHFGHEKCFHVLWDITADFCKPDFLVMVYHQARNQETFLKSLAPYATEILIEMTEKSLQFRDNGQMEPHDALHIQQTAQALSEYVDHPTRALWLQALPFLGGSSALTNRVELDELKIQLQQAKEEMAASRPRARF